MEERLKGKEEELATAIEKLMNLDEGYALKTCEENNIPLKEDEIPEKQVETLKDRD